MRFFPLILVAGFLFWLTPASAWAQELHCLPCGHSFGKVDVGSSSSYSIELKNAGTKVLRITSKSIQASAFSFGSFPVPMTIQPGASAELPVVFTPTAKGYADGTITLASNAPNSPLKMHVGGSGIYAENAELGVSPATLSFGNVTVGSSSTLQAKLTATNAAVTLSSDQSTSSEFAILGLTLPTTIQAGQSLQFTIQFTPNASGKASAKAGFISNALNSPTVEQLTGTGVAQAAHNVYLSWESGGGSPVGYNVYRGTAQAGPFSEINTALDSTTNYTDYTVASGTTYYYVTTEVNGQGQESAYSNEVQAVIP
ncbi:MAG: choice-of-anchor D domain-containing protein [Terriglobales bacterium]